MFFFGVEYQSIDSYITTQFVNNGTSFILFYMKYKPLFSLEFQNIFNRYLIHYLSGKYIQFDGMRHLIKVLHNRILLKNIHDEDTCNLLRPMNNNRIYSESKRNKSIYNESKRNKSIYNEGKYNETKYQSKGEMLKGIKSKFKNTIYYKFTSNSVLYRIDNIINQKYEIHSLDLLEFIINIFISNKSTNIFIDNFLKTLIQSHLYRNTDKLKIFLLLYTLSSTTKKGYYNFMNIYNLILKSKYIIPSKNRSSKDTFFYNLLINSDDTHCHDFYEYVCNEYCLEIDINYNNTCNSSSSNYKFYNIDTGELHSGSVFEYVKRMNNEKNDKNENNEKNEKNEKNENNKNIDSTFYANTPFKEIFDLWLKSVILYEIELMNRNTYDDSHTHKFLKSLYYLLIYMLHHIKSKRLKEHLFTYIKQINTIFLSSIISSIKLLERQYDQYSFTIIDSLQAENCKMLLNKYKKILHIRNNIFIKLAFRYSLEYYTTYLITKMQKIKNDSKTSELELLITDIKEFIRLVCYYKETSNIKLYKQLNKICVEKILLSQNYKKKYYNLGIYSHSIDDSSDSDLVLNNTNEFLNPHFIADYLKFIYFCYPKIKMNKQIYILLVDFFIYTIKHEDMWTVNELDRIWNELIFLIYKYSNSRKNITFPEEEKNIYFIHCILKRMHNMNTEMIMLLDVVNKYKLTNDESMKKYIDSINYTQNKKYLLFILLRQLKHPKLKDLFYKNAVREKFVNTLNETLFEFTPNVLKKYFNSYYGRVRKYTNYIANSREIYKTFNEIFELIFKYDVEKGYIKDQNIFMEEESIFRNILEEPMFFNFEKIKYINDLKYFKIKDSDSECEPSKRGILYSLNDYITQLNIQKKIESTKENIDFPDEFLDPIMRIEIKNPIILPNCDNIMDRSILEEMMLYNNVNPFTQDELYIEDVLKYNESEHSKRLIQNFLKRKEEFIQNL